MSCKFFENINGVRGDCKVEPPKFIQGSWKHPIVEAGCECRFFIDTESETPTSDDTESETPTSDDTESETPTSEKTVEEKPLTQAEKKKQAREELLKKKAEQDK